VSEEFLTAATGAGMTVALGLVMVFRSWTVAPARHRAPRRLQPARVAAAPTEAPVDPNADTHAFGVVRTGFGWCDHCQATTGGVITRNGFRCDDYAQHKAGGAW